MDEYIKREDLLELYKIDDPVLNENGHVPLPVIRQNIMDIPAADVAPVVHAHWQPYEDTVQCSACGFGTFMDGYFFVHGECTHANDRSFRFSFCPNCGAKMDGDMNE